MESIFYLIMIVLLIIWAIRSHNKIIKTYYHVSHLIKEYLINKNYKYNKDYAADALARKKLFKDVTINQGYSKRDALNLDVELDKFENALRGESVHIHSKNTQIMHHSSAFSVKNIEKNYQEKITVLGDPNYKKQPQLETEINPKIADTLDLPKKYSANKMKV